MDCTDASRGSGTQWRERQFACAQALAHVGSWERGLSDERAVWSDELCHVFGQPLGFSPTFEQFAALIHPDDRERVSGDLGRAGTGGTYESRYRIVRPDGQIRHVHGRADERGAPEGGAVTHVFGTIQDVTEQHEAEVARHEAQELFETAFSHAPIGMALITPDGRWLNVNHALCAITGWPESELLQRPLDEITHPDDVAADQELIEQLVTGALRGYQFEKRYIRRDRTEIWAELSVSLVRDAAGAPRHFIVQVEDISARKEAQRRLQVAEAEARAERDHATAIISAMSEGYTLTMDGEIKAVNEAMCVITGFSAAELIGAREPFPFCPPEGVQRMTTVLTDIRSQSGGTHELTLMRANGERFEAECTTRPAREENGRAIGFVNTLRDVSVQKLHQRELERLARTDSLTQLANRHVLQEALTREAARRAADGQQLALVLLDLDLFKQVNDHFGHPAGDAVLLEVARRLEDTVRTGEVLARVGGEEFAWLLPACDAEEAVAAADRARAAIASAPFGRAGTLTMSAGVGLVSTPSDGDALYRMADRALYEAKQSGRNRTCCHGAGVLRAAQQAS
ncbi:MAG TPA: PAS domain S-box protein [Solirubrobacteraceae bacterium]|jgi:diguanylate cyclase (GGDEF)-like protein/PAS domain S-box-containing protein|nr:PAS domain S-box protein [Solirubrobacteraceae bacterium]